MDDANDRAVRIRDLHSCDSGRWSYGPTGDLDPSDSRRHKPRSRASHHRSKRRRNRRQDSGRCDHDEAPHALPKPCTSPVAVRRQSMSRKSRSRTWMCGVPAWWTMDGLPRRCGISSSCEVPPVGCGGGWRGANNQTASNRQGRFATCPVARERRVVRCLSLSAQSARDSSRAERDKHRAAWRCAIPQSRDIPRRNNEEPRQPNRGAITKSRGATLACDR